ncbi:MAG: hypothetical protein ACK5OB_09455 [Pirellula sp.]
MTPKRFLSIWPAWLAAVLVSLAPGCRPNVTNVYGESDGYDAECSPSGLTVLRKCVEKRGHSTYTVRSLSPANKSRLNTIVWAPNAFPKHSNETYRWLSEWLASGNRTLIYIGRDFSPNQAYWSRIASNPKGALSAEECAQARAMAAIEHTKLNTLKRSHRSDLITPWNRWRISDGAIEPVTSWNGPWATDLSPSQSEMLLRSYSEPLNAEELTELRKALDWEPDPTQPAKPSQTYSKEWTPIDTEQLEITKELSADRLPQHVALLETGDGRALIERFSQANGTGSQVLVIANSSLFSNYGMLHGSHLGLADRMLGELPNGGVGFLTGTSDPPIRNDDSEDRQKGFEMLTVWPLNVITIHAAFLGIAAMIAAFPIFGRPKQRPKPSTSDFGQHIDAVGDMMQRSNDRDYAVRTIAEYFRVVRKDTASPWATMDAQLAPAESPFARESLPASGPAPAEPTQPNATAATPPQPIEQPPSGSAEKNV